MTRVVVTQADIDNGLRADSRSCPVALAVSRATGHAASVGITCIGLKSGEFFDPFSDIPDDVGRIIARFDEQGLMEPFEFCIPYEPTR